MEDIDNEDDNASVSLNVVANRLKTEFVRQKEIKSKRKYRPDPRFDRRTWWLKTARICVGLKATPEEYITAQFQYSNSPVFANTLFGKIAMKRYYQYMESIGGGITDGNTVSATAEELQVALKSTLQTLTIRCRSTDMLNPDVYATLVNFKEIFDPLAVMLIYGFDAGISNVYKEDALSVLRENPLMGEAINVLHISTDALYGTGNTL